MTPSLSPWVSPNDLLNMVAMCLMMMWSSKANCCFIFASSAPFHECLTLQLLDVRGIPKRRRQLLCILNSRDPLLRQSIISVLRMGMKLVHKNMNLFQGTRARDAPPPVIRPHSNATIPPSPVQSFLCRKLIFSCTGTLMSISLLSTSIHLQHDLRLDSSTMN